MLDIRKETLKFISGVFFFSSLKAKQSDLEQRIQWLLTCVVAHENNARALSFSLAHIFSLQNSDVKFFIKWSSFIKVYKADKMASQNKVS